MATIGEYFSRLVGPARSFAEDAFARARQIIDAGAEAPKGRDAGTISRDAGPLAGRPRSTWTAPTDTPPFVGPQGFANGGGSEGPPPGPFEKRQEYGYPKSEASRAEQANRHMPLRGRGGE